MVKIPKRGGGGGPDVLEKFPNNHVFFLSAHLTCNELHELSWVVWVYFLLHWYWRSDPALDGDATFGLENRMQRKLRKFNLQRNACLHEWFFVSFHHCFQWFSMATKNGSNHGRVWMDRAALSCLIAVAVRRWPEWKSTRKTNKTTRRNRFSGTKFIRVVFGIFLLTGKSDWALVFFRWFCIFLLIGFDTHI